ncbi:cyclopropane-fatty-acyl-phospholipid synthase family protein [Methylophilaceae bacterium]|nr:cyclopropane-fatty-acyl-phospholipid synthase family protein [Methylophilaceae bacterium]|tara:strand:- start:305 stop:1498 length:1194 start_codon:yes stop_codon:yes gene_type:complete
MNHLYKKIIHQRLSQIKDAHIIIKDGKSINKFGKPGNLSAKINILDTVFYKNIILGGTIGASESFIRGEWSSPNLTNVIRVLARNTEAQDKLENLFTLLSQPFLKVMHKLNENSVRGSKKNISRHYDLSNDFFSLFLDKNMMYSSAIYKSRKTSLEDASTNKLDVICKKLNLKKTDHVIEIGTGWGGFAIYAAKNYGCKVTTTTISIEQYKFAKQKIKEAGLGKKIKVLLKDYRLLKGQYDKLVSIEMIEAVGYQFYDEYFKIIGQLLKIDGEALIQSITIKDQRYSKAIQSVDFIQKYIFPGSCIPSITAIQNSLTSSTDLVINDIRDIGHHYARTLADWRKRFLKNKQEIRKLGFDDKFLRMWLFYFAYCEGGFEEKVISDIHLHITKPGYRNSI